MVRIGIDVGGTGIQTGVVSSDGKILAEESIVTLTDIPFSDQIVRMTDSVRSVLKSAGMTEDDVELVGVGIPGIASRETGEVITCSFPDGMGKEFPENRIDRKRCERRRAGGKRCRRQCGFFL